MKTLRAYKSTIGPRFLAILSVVALSAGLSGCVVYPARGRYYAPAVAVPVIAVRPPVVVVR